MPKSDFGAKSAFSAPKSVFEPRMRKRAQKCIFGPKSRFWGPKRTFGPKNDFGPKRHAFWLKFHWFYKHPRHGGTKTHFVPQIQFLHQKSVFASGNVLLAQNRLLSKFSTFWVTCAPSSKNGWGYVSS